MSDNKNSFLYTNYLYIVNFLSDTTYNLYNTVINSTYYHFAKNRLVVLKNKLFPPKVVPKIAEELHVDSDNLFLDNSKLISNDKPVNIDTDVKLDYE